MTEASRYAIHNFTDQYPILELIDRETDSSVLLCPERGGIVTSARLHGRELLYLDKETFYDPEANIRGGIPVLFPICGQLRQGEYEWEGRTYRMKNHGVARNRPWEVESTGSGESAWAVLVLRSSSGTLAEFPFDFELRFTYRLKDGVLSIEQEYRNLADRPMPMVAGFHPYFATETKNLPYVTDATRYLDYNDNETKPFEGTLDLTGMKESAALLDASRPEISFPLSMEAAVRLVYSEQFRYVVLWSVEGKPFVCVEPWTALNEALNDKEGLLSVKPGETLRAELHIHCEEA
ncbi:aldose epimerase [Cohnella sp. CFH 77786]|uniref:aldose epimerase family protein n=1 Tax=Cohnella sp. CFH 77786 TaxID=2662265 RepID=UPI001C609291|nr:aldose epimerase [Cohnella sp. CFH 77786]MBW5447475.1 aldose epimerase [Cohnella sp. CFH 77786]